MFQSECWTCLRSGSSISQAATGFHLRIESQKPYTGINWWHTLWQHSNLETRSDFIWLAALLAWGKRPNSLWSTAASKTTAKTNLCDACSSFFTSLMRPLIAPGRFWQNDGNYCTTLRWWESVEMFQSPTEHAWTSMMINFNPVFQVMTSRSESLRLQTRSKQSTSLRWWKTRDRSCTPTSRRASETAGW